MATRKQRMQRILDAEQVDTHTAQAQPLTTAQRQYLEARRCCTNIGDLLAKQLGWERKV